MSRSKTAAWLMDKQQKPLEVAEAPIPVLTSREVLIKVHAVALNPVDAAIQNLGLLWNTFPMILGSDLAGGIVEVGSEVRGFGVGDRVMAGVEKGAFQEYCSADIGLVARLPEHVSFAQGSVLPMGISTAAVTLFGPENMALELPQLASGVNGKVVLVWGGSSSVGSCEIQNVACRRPFTGFEAAVFAEWLPAALQSGQLKCKPEPFIAGRGLSAVQGACDAMARGVSAKKLVVELECFETA